MVGLVSSSSPHCQKKNILRHKVYLHFFLDDLENSMLIVTSGELFPDNYKWIKWISSYRTELFWISSNGSLFHCPSRARELDPNERFTTPSGSLLHSGGGDKSNLTPVICGSHYYFCGSKCTRLGKSGQPDLILTGDDRLSAASIAIRQGMALWLTGGVSCQNNYLDTTVVIDLDSKEEQEFLRLPTKLAGHCLEPLGNGGKSAILHGGDRYEDVDFEWIVEARSWLIEDLDREVDSGHHSSWLPLDSMLMERTQHTCGVLKVNGGIDGSSIVEIVVAAGGFNGLWDATDSVEFLILEETDDGAGQSSASAARWSEGPTLPVLLTNAGSATADNQARMFVAGGFTDSPVQELSREVFSLHCDNVLSCYWSKNDVELPAALYRPVVMVLPPFSAYSSGR